MTIITIGIDLAKKNIFAVHGVNENGHADQGPGTMPNMTACSFAVLHLLTQLGQRGLNRMRMQR